jgi:hypothetical protein
MLTGRNVVIVKNEDKTYTATPYDRIYLEFGAKDKLVNVETKTNKQLTKLADGSIFQKVVPATETSVDSASELTSAAFNLCTEDAKNLPDYQKITDAGWLLLLKFASDGRDLWIRAGKQKTLRGTSVDPDKANMKVAESYVKAQAVAGKVITIEVALTRLAKLAAMEAEEDAA